MIKYEKDKKRIGKIIKDIRGNQMMTEFAFKLGITKGTLNNYEKGRSIPSKELLLKILNYSEKEISLNEVLYGSSISYLLDIFKDVDSLKPLYFDSDETPVFKSSNIVINELNKLILSGDLSFGDEKNIIKKALEIDNGLKFDGDFLRLWNAYKLPSFNYELSESDDYKNYILPKLNENLKEIDDLKKFSQVLNYLTGSFKILDKPNEHVYFIKPLVKTEPKLEKYFDEEYLNSLNAIEKEELRRKFKMHSINLYNFFDELNDILPFDIEDLVNTYKLEKQETINILKKEGIEIKDESDWKKYRNQFWRR